MAGKTHKKIAIIGSGVVGEATGMGLLTLGHDVVFCDVNPVVIEQLENLGLKTCNIERLDASDREIFMMSVLTPTIDEKVDLRFTISASASLGKAVRDKKDYFLVVARSTVPPGTTEEIIIPTLEKYSGKKAGRDFGVCMSPEFLRAKTAQKDFLNPWIIVMGDLDYRSAQIMEELYHPFDTVKLHMSIKEAEFTKYVHNLFNANKISFFNEMRMIAQDIGIDADKVFRATIVSAEAFWNKEYGTKNMGPFGGACLPKDTRGFLTWAKEHLKKKTPILEAMIKVNEVVKEKRDHEY